LRRFISTIVAMRAAGGAFRAGVTASGRGGKQKPVFPDHQSLVEFEQRGRRDEHAALPNPARIQEQRGQPEDQAIDGGQIRRPLSGTIADQPLMFEQQRIRGEGAGAPSAQELREGGSRWMARIRSSRMSEH
jgi:hypothetical protein